MFMMMMVMMVMPWHQLSLSLSAPWLVQWDQR
jgi:hypothetical protein